MTLKNAIDKAVQNQRLIIEQNNERGIIEAVIPAPIDNRLFTLFINEVKFELLNKRFEEIDFDKIASDIGAVDFEVFLLFEGTLHKNIIEMSGSISFLQLD